MINPEIERFLDEVQSHPELSVAVDPPPDGGSEWWIDIAAGHGVTAVSWKPRTGFGIYVGTDAGYGSRPDELYLDPVMAARRVVNGIASIADGRGLQPMTILELRKLMEETSSMTGAVPIRSVDWPEPHQEASATTVEDTVRALGGEYILTARFPNCEVRLTHRLRRRGNGNGAAHDRRWAEQRTDEAI